MSNNNAIINAKGLRKSFNGKPAVLDATLQVKEGEIFGFLGPNGSGKTTTIRMLCGLLTPDAGSGTCIGYDIIKDSYKIKQQVGYMTQRFSLYGDLSIYENLDFMARLYNVPNREKAVAESIIELGMVERQNQLAQTLSGGWKQRLALSAALIHSPKLLLLDEPTAGVDPMARREFWTHIQKLANQGVTTLVSTHYMDEAERCNKLAYIFQGQILTQGTAKEIVKKSGLFTVEIIGEGNVNELADQLRKISGIDQVATLGNKMHVSSRNLKTLTEKAKSLEIEGWKWKQISPDLEDVFISLCSGDYCKV